MFNGRLFLEGGGAFGIGTDSNVLVDPAAELRQLEYAQRLRDRARNRMSVAGKSTGRTLFDAARRRRGEGARPNARARRWARQPTSCRSATDHLMLEGRSGDRILDAWIFAARNSAVDCVWTRGVKQVADGRHLRRDAVRKRFRGALQRLLA